MTPTDTEKPREWWIVTEQGQFGRVPIGMTLGPFNIPPEMDKSLIRVIEYSAFAQSQAELAQLRETLASAIEVIEYYGEEKRMETLTGIPYGDKARAWLAPRRRKGSR